MKILVGRSGSAGFDARLMDSMFRLRRVQFWERLKWEVHVDAGGREVDWYDALSPTYVVATDDSGSECLGCMRLLPTTGPNMLKDIFGEPLQCEETFAVRDVWEVSRMAVAASMRATGAPAFGFQSTATALIRGMLQVGVDMGLRAYVGVTTTSLMRMMRGIKLGARQVGKSALIGTAPTEAFHLPLAAAMLAQFDIAERREAA